MAQGQWHKCCGTSPVLVPAWSCRGKTCGCSGKTKQSRPCRGRGRCRVGDEPWGTSQPGNGLCGGQGPWVVGQRLCGDRRDPGGHRQGKSPAGLRVPGLFLVLSLSAEVPPARQEKGPEVVARSPRGCPQGDGRALGPSCPLHVGWSSEEQQRSPAQRAWGSAGLGTNPSISSLSPESFPGCFLVDTPGKPALYNGPEAAATSREGSRYSQLCISTL